MKVKCLIDCGAATTLGDYEVFGGQPTRRKLTKTIQLNTLTGNKLVNEEVIVCVPSDFNASNETMSIKLINLKDKNF